ncbi:hypothetical protein JOC78_000814 [Bacillus ectoiniformans]|nr:hypothetical protein [Bacillus ectoiniformans]
MSNRFASFVLKYVTHALLNANSMIMIIAKDVQKRALDVPRNAERWQLNKNERETGHKIVPVSLYDMD